MKKQTTPEIEKTKTEEHLKIILTDAEILTLGKEVATLIQNKGQLEKELDAVKKDFQFQISQKVSSIDHLSTKINNGYYFDKVACEITVNYTAKLKTTTRLDTGEIVRERTLTPEELQTKIFDESQ